MAARASSTWKKMTALTLTVTLSEVIKGIVFDAARRSLQRDGAQVRRLRPKLEPLDVPLRLVSHQNRGYCLVID
jgi:hypothetical protein